MRQRPREQHTVQPDFLASGVDSALVGIVGRKYSQAAAKCEYGQAEQSSRAAYRCARLAAERDA